MTVLCRSCRKEKAFEEFWWELRRDPLEGAVKIVQFQYYWSDRDSQFCSRKCLFENLEQYCQRAEARVQASPTPEVSLTRNPGRGERQIPDPHTSAPILPALIFSATFSAQGRIPSLCERKTNDLVEGLLA